MRDSAANGKSPLTLEKDFGAKPVFTPENLLREARRQKRLAGARRAHSTPPPCFILIDHALCYEGTSHHYLPPATYAHLQPELRRCHGALRSSGLPVEDVDFERSEGDGSVKSHRLLKALALAWQAGKPSAAGSTSVEENPR